VADARGVESGQLAAGGHGQGRLPPRIFQFIHYLLLADDPLLVLLKLFGLEAGPLLEHHVEQGGEYSLV